MKVFASVLFAGFVLAGCATGPSLGDAEKRALYRQHAGEPIESFRYFTSISGWTPLGDSAVAIWPRPNEAYLLSLDGPCTDLEFANAISLSSQMRTVYAKFDRVVPATSTGSHFGCPIREIRPLDVNALRDAQREMRAEVREVPREEAAPGS